MTNLSDDEGNAITQCICGKNSPHYDGLMIQCEDCGVWQHGACVNITKKNTPENYYCQKCRPEFHPYNSHLLKHKKLSTIPNSPPTKSFSPVTSSPKKRNTMNSLEASQNYNALLNLNANISSSESEPSSTTSGKRKRKATRNFSQDLSYSSNNSDSSIEKLKKIRKSHSQVDYDNNDNGSKLKESSSKNSKRLHKTSHKVYDDDYDEIDDIDDVEDDIDDDDYIPRNDGKPSRNLFNKKHENNLFKKTKFEEGSDHGKIKIKKDDAIYEDKSTKKTDLNKQEDSIRIKKERRSSKLSNGLGLTYDDLKEESNSEDIKNINGINEKTLKNKKNYASDSISHALRSSSELRDVESSGHSPSTNRKSSQRNNKFNNDSEESKSDMYSSSLYRNEYNDTDSTNNQNANSSSNTNIHISTRHSTRNTHRVNYQLHSASSHNHNNTHNKNNTIIKVKYPNQKASLNEMSKRSKQILEYLNRTRADVKELYRKKRLNSIIQAGGKVDIKEYRNEIKYTDGELITDNADSMTSSPGNDINENELTSLEMLEKLCIKINKFQQDYYE
ncbi:hypothetical protein H8356DRAFT_936012 [Neocallimastix lanati (nom. inval.)]|jgi:hypothetical protein|uniref:PHD-type domain-containing protein n=1 Tax=Neocallimastix californiae TaxID=1754190 RepID=A0A1Y2DWW9_9FUNG|nr:hypothetical protein H8356DRAFT_936012 [Neocallimastix sp. JGI-2020a]ORY63753.1 hypothetical protein LY90DRAFT_505203 [Neocallimastix californiae]|eukprot:ORY63753.1 hypothetical protein LY90DRAFT_505203 [Neocallimastix californiae]